ncbi:MAG TPA: LptF/LptG family permease [Candidatus Ozemobacteraceae bacterium]|nr:LptF/LptG family permease [Candidatus Ozemobacteraceae bacterium]
MIKTLDRYIFMQLLEPFCFGFFLFVVVISIDPLISALQNIVNDNVSAWSVIRWFMFRLPQDMIFTFPMSVLLSTLLVFGRMSKDSETVAMKAGGINFFRLLIPVVMFSLTVTGVSFVFNELMVPYSNRRAQEIRRTEILRLVEPEAAENVIMRAADGAFVYARKVFEKSQTMEKVLLEYYQDGKLQRRISADRAVYENKQWVLYETIDQKYLDGKVNDPTPVARYVAEGIREPIKEFARQTKRSSEMSFRELKGRIDLFERANFMETTDLKVELALKTSLPFASFFFALIGASFGLTKYRSGAFIGFGVSIIIIFIYYVLMSIFCAMGKSGYLPVYLSAWLQNIICLFVGIHIVRQVNT